MLRAKYQKYDKRAIQELQMRRQRGIVRKTLNLAAIRWGVCAILERQALQRDMHTLITRLGGQAVFCTVGRPTLIVLPHSSNSNNQPNSSFFYYETLR